MDIKSATDSVVAILRTLTPKVTVAFAITAWLLLLINGRGWMTLPQTVIVSALVVGILSTSLVFTGLWAWLWEGTGAVREAIVRAAYVRADKNRIEDDLDTRSGLKATERGVGHCEDRARCFFEALGRRKGEEGVRDKKLRRRLLDNLREIAGELDGVEAATRDKELKKRLLANLRETVRELEAEDVTGA